MKQRWLFVAVLALSLQACSLTGGRGSPEDTRAFLKQEMGQRGL